MPQIEQPPKPKQSSEENSKLPKKPRTIAFEYGGAIALLVFFTALVVAAIVSIIQGRYFALTGNLMGWFLGLGAIYGIGGCIGWLVYATRQSVVFIWKAVMSLFRRK